MSRGLQILLLSTALAGCGWNPLAKDSAQQDEAAAPPPRSTPLRAPVPEATDRREPESITPTPTPDRRRAEPQRQEPQRSAAGPRAEAPWPPAARPTVGIPVATRLGDATLAPGEYRVEFDQMGAEPRLRLLRDGQVAASEVALRPTRQPAGRPQQGAWLWKDTREEPMIRVYYQSGLELYFVVLEIVP